MTILYTLIIPPAVKRGISIFNGSLLLNTFEFTQLAVAPVSNRNLRDFLVFLFLLLGGMQKKIVLILGLVAIYGKVKIFIKVFKLGRFIFLWNHVNVTLDFVVHIILSYSIRIIGCWFCCGTGCGTVCRIRGTE